MTAMITKGGEYWEPAQEDTILWQRSYPKVEVHLELNAMACWLDANPGRRKTLRGMKKFCNSWLKRAQDNGGQGLAKKKAPYVSSRDTTIEQDLADTSWAY